MFGFRSSNLPLDRSGQNAWIKKTKRNWQLRWHDFFDADNDLADGEFDRPDPVPDEISCDHRLIFGLSRASFETRQKCFELFPSGNEMHGRFQTFLFSKSSALTEPDASARLLKIIALVEAIGPNEEVDFSKVVVVDRDSEVGFDVLNGTDDVTILLERSALAPHPVEDLKSVAAQLFLTEPLYAAAGNFYHLTNWVTAAMTGGMTDELHTELYELWAGGWEVALGTDGLILASRRI